MNRTYSVIFWLFLICFIPSNTHANPATSSDNNQDYNGGLQVRDIEIDQSGNLLIAGAFSGTCDFDPGQGVETRQSNGERDSFLIKLNNDREFVWVVTWGSSAAEMCMQVSVDNTGNIYVAGTYSSLEYFETNEIIGLAPQQSETKGMYLRKMDSTGNVTWVKTVGKTMGYGIHDMVIDSTGNIYIIGRYTGPVNFLTQDGIDGRGGYGTAILKCNPEGILQWIECWGLDVNSMCLDKDDNIYLAGGTKKKFYQNISDIEEPETISFNSRDGFLVKLNSNGHIQWTRIIDLENDTVCTEISIDDNNYVLIGGHFGQKDTSTGNLFLTKYNTDGSFIWLKQWGGHGPNDPDIILTDTNDIIYILFSRSGIIDFDPGEASIENESPDTPGRRYEYIVNGRTSTITGHFSNIFILTLDTEGEFICFQEFGNRPFDNCKDMLMDIETQEIILVGRVASAFEIYIVNLEPGEL